MADSFNGELNSNYQLSGECWIVEKRMEMYFNVWLKDRMWVVAAALRQEALLTRVIDVE